MKNPLRVLCAPIHYVLDAQHTGSEFSWSYMIYKSLSTSITCKATFITGGVRGIDNQSVYNLACMDPSKIDSGTFNVMRFYYKLFSCILQHNLISKHDCIHHVLPFYIGHSWNISPFISRKPFVIGPIQPGLTIQDTDADSKDARGNQKSSFSITGILQNIVIKILKPILSVASYATLNRAHALICVDTKTKNMLIAKGIQSQKIYCIPPGIDSKRFSTTLLKPTTQVLSLVTVCYLVKRKRVDLIIHALAEVIAQGHNIHLTIVGDGPQRKSLENMVQKLSIQKYVTFKGHVPQSDIPKIYSSHTLFVHMSQSEGFSVVSMEAMASGLAVISTSVGGFDTLITNGKNGFLIDIDDSHALAQRIVYCATHRAQLRKMGYQARETIVRDYDWEKSIIPQYEAIYHKLCQPHTTIDVQ